MAESSAESRGASAIGGSCFVDDGRLYSYGSLAALPMLEVQQIPLNLIKRTALISCTNALVLFLLYSLPLPRFPLYPATI
jgi:hypothetical protein